MRSIPRLRGTWLVAAFALLLAAGPAGVAALQRLVATSPSPATGTAQVIAQGVSPMPAAEIAWRVVVDTADLPADGQAEQRALGFALADRDAVMLDSEASGIQTRLAGGEAAFVPDGLRQQRSSLDAAPVPYYRIALVPSAQAGDAGGDRLVLSGAPFAAPAGRAFDIDLLRDVLQPREQRKIVDPGTPVLLLVTEGSVDVRTAGSQQPARIAAGQAAQFTGPVDITGVGPRQATIVAGVIGPEVPPPPAPQTGSIGLAVLACPEELTPAVAAAAGFAAPTMAACVPKELDQAPALVLADGSPLAPDEADAARALYRWTDLLYGPFPVAQPDLPRPFKDWVLLDSSGAVVAGSERSGVAPTSPTPGAFTVSANPSDLQATLYLFTRGIGQATLQTFACPAAMTEETFDPAACAPSEATADLLLTDLEGESVQMAQAIAEPGQPVRWDDLPFGTWGIAVQALPDTYDRAVFTGAEFDAASGGYRFTVDAAAPRRDLGLYLLGGEGAGSVTVRLFDCPVGVTVELASEAACAATDVSGATITAEDGTGRGVDAGTLEGNALTWSDLPAGNYGIYVPGVGGAFADAVSPVASATGPGTFGVTVSADQAALDVPIYRLQAAAGTPAPTETPTETPAETPAGPPVDAAADDDADGLSNEDEAALGTDPAAADTDGDGRADGDEVGQREFQTDPTLFDTDGDGVGDGDELLAGTNPLDPASVPAG